MCNILASDLKHATFRGFSFLLLLLSQCCGNRQQAAVTFWSEHKNCMLMVFMGTCVGGLGGKSNCPAMIMDPALISLETPSTMTMLVQIIALNGPRSSVVQSPYLDIHGDEDPELRRGRPLFLQKNIYSHLARLWSMQLDFDSVLLHASRCDLEFL